MTKYQSLVCWLLLLAVGSELSSGFEITSPEELKQSYTIARLSRFGSDWSFDETPFSGRLLPSWITLETPTTEDHVLLICPDVLQQSIEQKVRNAYQNVSNLVAIVVCGDFSSVPGFGQYLTDNSAVNAITVPVFETERSIVQPIITQFNQDNALVVSINFEFTGANPWVELYDTGVMIAMSVVDGGLAAACIAYGIYQLIRFTKQDGLESTPEQLTCWIEIFIGAARVVYLCVDPLFSRNIFHNIAGNILLTLTVPFYAATTATMVYYWKELVFPKWHRNIMFLDKLRIWVVAVILPVAIAAEIAAAVLRGVFLAQDYLSYISGAICTVISVSSGVLFVVHGIRVMRDLKTYTISTIDIKKQRLLTRVARILMAVSALKLTLIVLFALMLTPYFTTPQGFVGIWFTTFFVLSAISLLHLIALGSPLPIKKPLAADGDKTAPGTLETTATSPRIVRVLDPLGGPTTGVEVVVHEWSETEAQSDKDGGKDGRDSLRSSRNIGTMSPGDRNSIANLSPYRAGGETTDDEDYRKKSKPSVRQIVITDYSQKGSEDESSVIDDSKMTSSRDSHSNRITNAANKINVDSDVSDNSFDSSSDSDFATSRSAEEVIVTRRAPQPKPTRRQYSDSEHSD